MKKLVLATFAASVALSVPANAETFVLGGTSFVLRPEAGYNPNFGATTIYVSESGFALSTTAAVGIDSESYGLSLPFASSGWTGTQRWDGEIRASSFGFAANAGYIHRVGNLRVGVLGGFGLTRTKLTDNGIYTVAARHWYWGNDTYTKNYTETESFTRGSVGTSVLLLGRAGAHFALGVSADAGYAFPTKELDGQFVAGLSVAVGVGF